MRESKNKKTGQPTQKNFKTDEQRYQVQRRGGMSALTYCESAEELCWDMTGVKGRSQLTVD